MTTTSENIKKILLVEDDRIVRTVNKMLLEEIGYAPDLAEDGRQALEMAQNNPYDLILMDIGLPYIDGINVTIKIRAGEKTKRTPIVGLTAYTLAEVEDKCLSAGMDKVLNKPTNTHILQQVITQFAN